MQDYSWLVDRRFQIQTQLVDLNSFLANNLTTIEAHKIQRRICGLLIGATFSLWRAVFLTRVGDREWNQILAAGQNFMERVIETNAIGFSDEYNDKNRTWAVGYYLNNARFRVEKSIRELLEAKRGIIPASNRKSLATLLKKLEVGISEEKRQPRDVWDETDRAVKRIFRLMQRLT